MDHECLSTLTERKKTQWEEFLHRCGIDSDPGFAVFELGEEYEIDPKGFLSMGKSTPFAGKRVHGRCLATVYDGKLVYSALN